MKTYIHLWVFSLLMLPILVTNFTNVPMFTTVRRGLPPKTATDTSKVFRSADMF
jgi:hypothetical protein